MKRLVVFLGLALALLPLQVCAQQDPDDQYIAIYILMQQANTLGNSGDLKQALADYIEAQRELEQFQKVFPDWYPKIVNYRLNYLAEKIAKATAKLPPVPAGNAPSPKASASSTPGTSAATAGVVSNSNARLEAQIESLHGQIRQLQGDNETLQAKLREALAVRPAAVDPRAVARMRTQLVFLMKENDLLKVSLARGRGGTTPAGVNPESIEQLRRALAEANRKLADQTARADKLAQANQALQARIQSLLTNVDAAEALREENKLLKKQLAGLKSALPVPPGGGNANAALAKARVQIARLQSDAAVGWLERAALENRVKQLQTAAVTLLPVKASSEQSQSKARIRELERERDDLLAKLGEANKKLRKHGSESDAARIEALARQVDTLQARLAVDEAQAVPYTPEELALFRQSAPQPSPNLVVGKKSIQELPNGSASLAARAQGYFSARQFGMAEKDYQEILRRDGSNPAVLANLAAIELEQDKVGDAEKHVEQALARDPDDAYSLMVLGRVRLTQGKYDEALDVLSRAEKLDPKNPAIDNYLGVTLAHKGLRAQAETALRRAVLLDPNYAAAQNNLAVIYLTQQPPLVELARWHYQKALAAGQPRNPDLEKLLDKESAPAKSQ